MSNLLIELVKALVAAMTTMLTPEKVKAIIDKAFDAVETKVWESNNHWDDVIVVPMLNALRIALAIPDNDPVVEEPSPENPETPIV